MESKEQVIDIGTHKTVLSFVTLLYVAVFTWKIYPQLLSYATSEETNNPFKGDMFLLLFMICAAGATFFLLVMVQAFIFTGVSHIVNSSCSLPFHLGWASVAYGLLPVTAVTFYILAIGRTGNTQWGDGVWGQFSLTLLMYVLYLLFLRFHGSMTWVKAVATTCVLCVANLLLSFLLGGA